MMKNSLPFLQSIHSDLGAVEDRIRAQSVGFFPAMEQALELLISSGGKRVRQALTLLTGRLLNAPMDRLVTLASAIELLHTATLVHDDLIDGASLRRGVPTLNATWTPSATVLAGDFLFACAARLAAETGHVPVIHLFSHTLAVIVNGEITQQFSSRCTIKREDYFSRIYAKTASLFETCTTSAAMISAAADDTVESAKKFGYSIGMAFQIVDDILDFTGQQSTIGKPVGSDLLQGLVTLPVIIYVEEHPDDQAAHDFIEGRCADDQPRVLQLIDAIRKSGAIEASYREAMRFVEEGIQNLKKLPDGAERSNLEELALYFSRRDF